MQAASARRPSYVGCIPSDVNLDLIGQISPLAFLSNTPMLSISAAAQCAGSGGDNSRQLSACSSGRHQRFPSQDRVVISSHRSAALAQPCRGSCCSLDREVDSADWELSAMG